MTTSVNKSELLEIYRAKGLNGLYAYLRKNGVYYTVEVKVFGLETNSKVRQAKRDFLAESTEDNVLHLHYYSRLIHSKRWNYNQLRGIKLTMRVSMC